MKRIVIIGAGTAGTMMANRLRRLLDESHAISVFDLDEQHIYQPGLLFVPFGMYRPEELVRTRSSLVHDGVNLRFDAIERVDSDRNELVLKDGTAVGYDVLIIATGTHTAPEATPGMLGPHWHKTVSDFYTLEGATALADAMARLQSGHLVVNIADMPIKCPVAPLEFVFLADAFFTERGLRDRVKITFVTPLDVAFTKPTASHMLGDLLERRNINVVSNFVLQDVDGEKRQIRSYDEQVVEYDLLVTIPLHQGAPVIERSGLGDAMHFVPTDKHTLQVQGHPNIFALGDATNLPTSKAGSVAHFQSEVLAANVIAFLEGRPFTESFDGHANCFIETGFGKAMLLDFNYETEPLPGRSPCPA